MASAPRPADVGPKLLWNPDNVKDVAESVGVGALNEDALRCLSQDVEYRIGQLIVEALRFMRAANRTILSVQDMAQALRVLDVQPLYGYESTRPLRYGEASLGPGQPLFYIDDEEVDFEKLINAPLPRIPRDAVFTAHWLALEGVQPSIPQNPSSTESRSHELLPKGPSANPALSALAGNDNVAFKPSVKHIVSKELTLYFDKVQAAILNHNPDEEVLRLREAALESVRSDPGLAQLVPYFTQSISNQVVHCLDNLFALRQMMDLTAALISNPFLFLDAHASHLSAPVVTCLLAKKLGADINDGTTDALREQYQLREIAASLLGKMARTYSKKINRFRTMLVTSCLKAFLTPTSPPGCLYGAIAGISSTGGTEAIRNLVLPNLKHIDANVLQPLRDRVGVHSTDFEMLVGGGIVKAVTSLSNRDGAYANGVNGTLGQNERDELIAFLGPIIGERIAQLGDHQLNKAVLEARSISQ